MLVEAMPMRANSRDAALPWVRASVIRCFATLVTDLGGAPDELLKDAGIPPATLDGSASIILLRNMAQLLEHAAERLDCADFGLRLAERQREVPCFGAIELVMRNSATLGEAFAFIAQHSAFFAPRAELEVIGDDGTRHLRYDLGLAGMPRMRQAVELGCLQPCHAAFRLARARPSLLWFQHQPALPAARYRRYFGAEVRFGMPYNAIWFSDDDWRAPIADRDERLLTMAVEAVEGESRDPLIAQTMTVIARLLPSGRCTYDTVAATVGLAPRTLRRYLLKQGLVFEDMKDAIRREIVENALLGTRLSMTDISDLLGYANGSSVSRSCARWFGVVPRAIRSGRPLAANAKLPSRRIGTGPAGRSTAGGIK